MTAQRSFAEWACICRANREVRVKRTFRNPAEPVVAQPYMKLPPQTMEKTVPQRIPAKKTPAHGGDGAPAPFPPAQERAEKIISGADAASAPGFYQSHNSAKTCLPVA